jgi:hypothetical protein
VGYRKWRKQFLFLASYFLIFFFEYTSLHNEGFYFNSTKYTPSLLLPIILFSSLGLYQTYEKVKEIINKRKLFLVIFLLFLIFTYLYSLIAVSNSISSYFKNNPQYEEFLYLKNTTSLRINTSCSVIMNGPFGLFPYYYHFKKNPLIIRNLNNLSSTFQNLNSSNCYYFYQGYYNKEGDQFNNLKRIYNSSYINFSIRKL